MMQSRTWIFKNLHPNLRGGESFRPKVSFYTSESEGEECVCFSFLYNCALHASCLLVFIQICVFWIFMNLIDGSYLPGLDKKEPLLKWYIFVVTLPDFILRLENQLLKKNLEMLRVRIRLLLAHFFHIYIYMKYIYFKIQKHSECFHIGGYHPTLSGSEQFPRKSLVHWASYVFSGI